MGRHSTLVASLALVAALLGAPAAAASPRPAEAVPGSATPVAATAPPQEPDAPADDGTGGSAEDENPEPGAVDQDIIPRPNSGHEPTDAGDRGGALQVVVFVAIVAGVGAVAALAVRDVRRSRARAAGDPMAGSDGHERLRR